MVRRVSATPLGTPVAFTAYAHGDNVYLMDAGGGAWTTVTTRAAGSGGSIRYPYYSWSPDGKYLLLVRETDGRDAHTPSTWDLLLMNRQGDLLRTLVARAPIDSLFPPSWAVDGDQIAYVARITEALIPSRARWCGLICKDTGHHSSDIGPSISGRACQTPRGTCMRVRPAPT
jgi:Tol biopolymer transport system component